MIIVIQSFVIILLIWVVILMGSDEFVDDDLFDEEETLSFIEVNDEGLNQIRLTEAIVKNSGIQTTKIISSNKKSSFSNYGIVQATDTLIDLKNIYDQLMQEINTLQNQINTEEKKYLAFVDLNADGKNISDHKEQCVFVLVKKEVLHEDGRHNGFRQYEKTGFLVIVPIRLVGAHGNAITEECPGMLPMPIGDPVGSGHARGGVNLIPPGPQPGCIGMIGDEKAAPVVLVVPVGQVNTVLERPVGIFMENRVVGDAQVLQFAHDQPGEGPVPDPFQKPVALMETPALMLVLFARSGGIVAVWADAAVAGV